VSRGRGGGNDKLARSTSRTFEEVCSELNNNYNIIRTYIRWSISFQPGRVRRWPAWRVTLKRFILFIIYKVMADKNETKRSVPYDVMLVSFVRYRPPTLNMFTQRSRFIPDPTAVGWFSRVQTVVSTRRRSPLPLPPS